MPAPGNPAHSGQPARFQRLALRKTGLLAVLLVLAWIGWTAHSRMAAPAFVPKSRIALVIGNSKYLAAPPLLNPGNDARGVAEALEAQGFKVSTVLDADLATLRKSVADFIEQAAGPETVALFYFAGHGIQLDWTNYLIPTDARLAAARNIPDEALDLNEVLSGLRKRGARMNIVVLDACRDNPFAGARDLPRGLAQIDAPPRTLLAYATAPGSTAADGEGKNGLYTGELLQQLQKGNARIEDVLKRVRYNVRARSRGLQVPWESTSLEEDFYIGRPSEDVLKTRLAGFNTELEKFQRAMASRDVETVRGFLEQYPSGAFSELALYRLESLLKETARPIAATQVAISTPGSGPTGDTAKAADTALTAQRPVAPADASAAAPPASPANSSTSASAMPSASLSVAPSATVSTNLSNPSATSSTSTPAIPASTTATPREPPRVAATEASGAKPRVFVMEDDYVLGETLTFKVVDHIEHKESMLDLRVTAIAPDHIDFNDGDWRYDRLGNFVRRIVPRRGTTDYTPNQLFIREYQLGKRWQVSWIETTGQKQRRLDATARIRQEEEVVTGLGQFRAFRQEVVGQWDDGISMDFTFWMVPGYKRPVKAVYVAWRNGMRTSHSTVTLERVVRP